jgi:hypothetical protein
VQSPQCLREGTFTTVQKYKAQQGCKSVHPDHSAGSVLGDGVTEPIPVFKGEGCSGRMCMTVRVVSLQCRHTMRRLSGSVG